MARGSKARLRRTERRETHNRRGVEGLSEAPDATQEDSATEVVERHWDGPMMVRRCPSDEAALRALHAWADESMDPAVKSAYKFPHHEVDADGKVGAAVTNALRIGLARLESADIPEGDREAVREHLQGHLEDWHRAHPDASLLLSDRDIEALAAAEGLFADDAFAPPPADGEPMGACSCGHMAARHSGQAYDGACMEAGCDCEAFEESAVETSSATSSSAPAEGANYVAMPNENGEIVTYRIDGLTLVPEETTSSVWMAFTHGTVENGRQAFADGLPAMKGTSWQAVLCPEGRPTDDGRIFAPGSVEWRELPLTLMGMVETQEGHDGAQVAGRIDRVWRDGDLIRAEGEFDTGDFGVEIARLVAERVLSGISVDIAVKKLEITYRSDVLDEEDKWIEQAAEEDTAEEDEGEDGPNLIDVMFGDGEDVIFVVRQGVIGAATVCPFQAFADATIEVAASMVASADPMVWTVTGQAGWTVVRARQPREEGPGGVEGRPDGSDAAEGLTASAAGLVPDAPPADWFEDPALEELTPLTVTEDGRVYGHAAPWDECHIGIPGVCTTAPHSHSDYSYFMLKEIVCDDGSRLSVGTITVDAPHAPNQMSRAAATAHYDHTGTASADVIVGEDDFGIWLAGALRPDASADQVRKLRGAALSGDWRDVNGNLELVGLLAVNVPGFPIPRTRALVAAGDSGEVKVLALTAAGVHVDGKIVNTVGASDPVPEAVAQQLAVLADVAEGRYADLSVA